MRLGDTMETAGFGVHTGRNGFAGEMVDQLKRNEEPSASASYEPEQECPKCGSSKVHRSHRRFWDRYVAGIVHSGERLFRCHRCQNRFWAIQASSLPKVITPKSPGNGAYNSPGREKRCFDNSVDWLTKLDTWLYRKHGLTLQLAVTLSIGFSLVVYFLFIGFSDFAH